MVREKAEHVLIDIEGYPKEKKTFIDLVDILFFTGIAFLIMVSKDMRFTSTSLLIYREKKN
jgi:hypothetical protein